MKRIVMLAAACVIAVPAFAQNVATVNGKAIPQKSLDQFVKLLVSQGATDSPQLREQVKQEMINRQVSCKPLSPPASPSRPTSRPKSNWPPRHPGSRPDGRLPGPSTRCRMPRSRPNTTRSRKNRPARWNTKVRHHPGRSEKTANDLLAQLKSNKGKFDDLAKKNSKDPGSAEKGGDLGWAPPTNYVQPFAQAVTQLKKGQLVDKPVQTQFGWHIIMVDDTRPVEFPPLDQVRPQLEEMLRQQTLADYQKELREKAKIQ